LRDVILVDPATLNKEGVGVGFSITLREIGVLQRTRNELGNPDETKSGPAGVTAESFRCTRGRVISMASGVAPWYSAKDGIRGEG